MAVANPDDLRRYARNFRDEVDGIALYRSLAAAEKDPRLSGIYSRLAESEQRHLDLWRERIREAGGTPPKETPSLQVRVIGLLARRFGPATVAPLVARLEQSAFTMYDTQPEALEAGLPGDERGHAVISREIARSMTAGDIVRIEGRHIAGSSNALRAAILGATDGLVSNLCLVMSVAGADPGHGWILRVGLGGLVAGAASMGLGEWISVRSSAEAFERQVSIERDEIALMPEEEAEELALIYEAKGIPTGEARQMASRIVNNPVTALDTLTREELGMSPDEAGNPWTAAITSASLFSLGALMPILPWLLASGLAGVLLSGLFAGVWLFGLGAATSIFTGRGALFTGGRLLVFGLACAVVTYGIGKLVGGSV